ncbi:MAG: response regulator, partial [Rhodospirillales bacterium]|nr:response regulator [Rhodospirillales bacterium]
MKRANDNADGPRVMVVEDDGTARILLRMMLTKLGCKVEAVTDGRAALAAIAAAAQVPEVIFADW